ncbi:hypothetical protein AAY473_011630 [Plecturocebus cupreus]
MAQCSLDFLGSGDPPTSVSWQRPPGDDQAAAANSSASEQALTKCQASFCVRTPMRHQHPVRIISPTAQAPFINHAASPLASRAVTCCQPEQHKSRLYGDEKSTQRTEKNQARFLQHGGTHLTVEQMEKLLKAGILYERGLVFWLLKQQSGEPDKYEGRMIVVQVVTSIKELQELLWPCGLFDELVYVVLWVETSPWNLGSGNWVRWLRKSESYELPWQVSVGQLEPWQGPDEQLLSGGTCIALPGTWTNLETIILNKLTQEHRTKHRMFSFLAVKSFVYLHINGGGEGRGLREEEYLPKRNIYHFLSQSTVEKSSRLILFFETVSLCRSGWSAIARCARRHAWLIIAFLVETEFHHVGQAGLELLTPQVIHPPRPPKVLGLQA